MRSQPFVPALSIVLVAGVAHASVSSGSGGSGGVWLNPYLGATSYYNAGFTGTRVILGNVEGGHVWNGHETLSQGQITRYITGPGAAFAPSLPEFPPSTPNYDWHATAVSAFMVGRRLATDDPGGPGDQIRTGLAHGAALWSGAIAAGINIEGQLTSVPWAALANTYRDMFTPDQRGLRADVVNSSWGEFSPNAINRNRNRFLDALVYNRNGVLVVAAGNSGPDPNTVWSPALAKNNISVGALTGDLDPVPFNRVADFSSRGPHDFALPTSPTSFTRITGVRAAVDIAAPGDNLTVAEYRGRSGWNRNGQLEGQPGWWGPGESNMDPDHYYPGINGTSYAAPMVAAGAGLVVDAARARGDAHGADGRVVRALLMTGADKTQGWTNNSTIVSNVLTTTQGIDWAAGAGRMNLANTYRLQTSGTADVPGTGGGIVGDLGWDFGTVAQGAPNDYVFSSSLSAGWTFSATLSWWADDRANLDTLLENTTRWGAQDILTLSLFSGTPGSATLVAESIGQYNLNQHLFLSVPADGSYFLRVTWAGELYDFVNKPNAEAYGLAWTIPTPGTSVLLGAVGLLATRRRRRC